MCVITRGEVKVSCRGQGQVNFTIKASRGEMRVWCLCVSSALLPMLSGDLILWQRDKGRRWRDISPSATGG